MKTTILFLLVVLFSMDSFCQIWIQQGGDIDGIIYDLEEYDGSLYVGGRFDSIGNQAIQNLAKWDGNQYTSINATFTGTGFVQVKALCSFGSNLVVAGKFSTVNGIVVNSIAQWDGVTWSQLGTGFDGEISDLHVFNNQLYAVGAFKMDGYGALAAVWTGTDWVQIGPITWLNGTYYVQSIMDYNNELFIGGGLWTFSQFGVKKFDGSDWVAPGDGIVSMADSYGSSVPAMETIDNMLFVGGNFSDMSNSSLNNLATWDGSFWNNFNGNPNFVVNTIKEFNGNIYFAGESSYSSSDNIAKWDGVNFEFFDSIYPIINSLQSFGNDIYAGGSGVLMKLDNSTEIEFSKRYDNKTIIYPNPSNGVFNIESNSTENQTIKIINLLGDIVYTTIKTSEILKVDLSNLPRGVYLIRTIGTDETTNKIVIQ